MINLVIAERKLKDSLTVYLVPGSYRNHTPGIEMKQGKR